MRHVTAIILATLFATFMGSSPLIASEEQRSATTIAKWDESGGLRSLVVNTSDLLTPAQREIVNSGFSTFTILAISDKKIIESESLPSIKVACSVKYDTWEERYSMIRVDPSPLRTLVVKDYKSWANECLTVHIEDQTIISGLSSGGTLHAILQIRQSSPDEGAKIKNWLVRQQSGFMQGLYAHMLGDFQIKGFVRIIIQVPPGPIAGSTLPTKTPASPKGI